MINFSEYIGKRVALLINAHAYDASNSESDTSTSLILTAEIISEDAEGENVVIDKIKVCNPGLFLSIHGEDPSEYRQDDDEFDEDNQYDDLIRITRGQLDKRFIIGVFEYKLKSE